MAMPPNTDGNPVAEKITKRYDALENDRGVWEEHWEEVAERVIPRYANSFVGGNTPGEKRTEKMFDSSAAIALDRFSAVMESMLTPRNQTWHRLKPSDPFLLRDRESQLWFEEATKILFRHRYSASANFASQVHEVYTGLGAFGTGALFPDINTKTGVLRYQAIHLKEILFDENHQGLIDTAMRKFKMTARQMEQKWGEDDKLPAKVRDAAKDEPSKCFEVLHCVKPREDRDVKAMDNLNMPFASYYILYADKLILEESGYNTFPYAVSRYIKAPGEMYGRSPAMLALPSIKVLNEQKKTMLKQGHRVTDPILLVHDDGILDGFAFKPGAAINGGMTAEGNSLVGTLPTGNLSAGDTLMDMEKAVINDVFLVSLFQILVESPQMTATEVLERTREKGMLLAPSMGRQQTELLDPLINRELDLLALQGLLPPMPPALEEAEGEYEIEYDSPLSRAQRAEENAGTMRTLESALSYAAAAQDPSVFDMFNTDKIFLDIGMGNAMPISHFRTLEEIDQIRAGREQQMQQQQMIEAAPAIAGVAKAVQ